MNRACYICKIEKPLDGFTKNKSKPLGVDYLCKQCRSDLRRSKESKIKSNAYQRLRGKRPHVKKWAEEYQKKYRATEHGRNVINSYFMKKLYGISIDDYTRMFTEQRGCCAICKKNQKEFSKRLHVDHDHETGMVRGLLCHYCNTALGAFEENENLLISALEYLKIHKKGESKWQ